MEILEKIIEMNGLIFAFLFVGLIMFLSFWISKNLLRGKIPGAAIAILIGLGLAFLGDKKGISDIPIFAGIA
ncbi:MAG: malonate transporter subunit MadM, partial [Flavobacteriaceae bacterium]